MQSHRRSSSKKPNLRCVFKVPLVEVRRSASRRSFKMTGLWGSAGIAIQRTNVSKGRRAGRGSCARNDSTSAIAVVRPSALVCPLTAQNRSSAWRNVEDLLLTSMQARPTQTRHSTFRLPDERFQAHSEPLEHCGKGSTACPTLDSVRAAQSDSRVPKWVVAQSARRTPQNSRDYRRDVTGSAVPYITCLSAKLERIFDTAGMRVN